MANGKSITITIRGGLLEQYRLYADLTGHPIAKVARYALKEWMEDCGYADIEVLTGCPMPYADEEQGGDEAEQPSTPTIEQTVHPALVD